MVSPSLPSCKVSLVLQKKLDLPPDVDDLDCSSRIDDDGKEAEGEGEHWQEGEGDLRQVLQAIVYGN